MVTVSFEDQDGLIGFLFTDDSADCIQCVGTLCNCVNTFKQ